MTLALTAIFASAGLIGTASSADKAPAAAEASDTKAKVGDIVAVADGAGKFTTLCAALKAAGLEDTLRGKGPFTVFAPTDEAFAKLPKGTLEDLLKPENKGTLTTVLTYHVVAGRVTSGDLVRLIKAGRGKAVITTVSGGKLTAKFMGKNVVLIDAKGGTATVTTANVIQSNGVIHVIDTVLLPK